MKHTRSLDYIELEQSVFQSESEKYLYSTIRIQVRSLTGARDPYIFFGNQNGSWGWKTS